MLSVAAAQENTIMSYSVNETSMLVVMVGAVVSMVTLEALETELELDLEVDDALLDGADAI